MARVNRLYFSGLAPDALTIDVFRTVRKVGFPIAVLTDPSQVMNRYGFIFIEDVKA